MKYRGSVLRHLSDLQFSRKPVNMMLSFPFLFVFSAALCVSNVSLIRHEGFRGVNVLGIILSFLLIGGAVFIFCFDYAASGSMIEVMIHDMIVNFSAAVYLYFECMLIGVIIADALAVRYEPEPDKDFITYYTPVLFTEVGDIAPNKVKKKLLSPWARARPSGNFKKGCSHVS